MELEAKPLAQKENRQSLSWLSFVLFSLIFFFFLIKPKTVTPKTGVFIKLGVCVPSPDTHVMRECGAVAMKTNAKSQRTTRPTEAIDTLEN